MKATIMRCVAVSLAILFAIAYFFVPWVQESVGVSNNARGKQTLNPGDRMSWEWAPAGKNVTELGLHLSGMKNAQEMTLTAELSDAAGKTAASVSQAVSQMGDGEELVLKGHFSGNSKYTLTLIASGEGSVKLRGEETDDGFYPQLSWRGTEVIRNPVLLYFAFGCALVALTPLRPGKTGVHAKGTRRGREGLSWATLVLVVSAGLLLALLKPPYEEGSPWLLWDEDVHWSGVQDMLILQSTGWPKLLREISTWTPGYLPLILGANLANLFTSHMETLHRVGTVFSVLIYGMMAMTAVRHAPRYKASFMVAAALPAHLYLAAGMTYDTVVIGCILLGTALVLEALDQEGELTAAQGMTLLSVLGFGTIAKPAYSVVLLLLLMIPAKKFGSGKRAWLFRLLVVGMLLWCATAVALPGGYDSVRAGDSRFEGTDAAAQLSFLNSQPLRWLMIPLDHLFGNWQFLTMAGIAHFAYMGNNMNHGYAFTALLLIAAPLAVCGEPRGRKGLLKPGRRILLGGIALLSECVLILSQYLVSSPVGGGVHGMQARYFLPVWILLALALMLPEKARGFFRKPGPWIAGALWAVCLGLNVWRVLTLLRESGCI